MIANALGGGRARTLAVKMQKSGRGLVPWAGIAVALPQEPRLASSTPLDEADTAAAPSTNVAIEAALQGQAFCFLPLPCTTGKWHI